MILLYYKIKALITLYFDLKRHILIGDLEYFKIRWSYYIVKPVMLPEIRYDIKIIKD